MYRVLPTLYHSQEEHLANERNAREREKRETAMDKAAAKAEVARMEALIDDLKGSTELAEEMWAKQQAADKRVVSGLTQRTPIQWARYT